MRRARSIALGVLTAHMGHRICFATAMRAVDSSRDSKERIPLKPTAGLHGAPARHMKTVGVRVPHSSRYGLSGMDSNGYSVSMPWNLKRFQHSGQTHFVTFSCYHRAQLFLTNASGQIFEEGLERIRHSFELCIYGYVIMPEHVHLLLSEPRQRVLKDALKSLKQGVSRRLIGEAEHFWQRRYYDFNIRNRPQFVEKLRYIHRNPVKRGLCARPEDWRWSSFLHYATGAEGRVQIESEWTARKRERERLAHSSQQQA